MGRTFHYRTLVAEPRRRIDYRCVVCCRPYPPQFLTKCQACGGAIDVFYDLSRVRLDVRQQGWARYLPLLPVTPPHALVSLGAGNTPCVHAVALGRLAGLAQLYLKDETQNPTRTTKDRAAEIGLAYLHQCGIHTFTLASSGNISTAFARGVLQRPEFHAHIFVATPFLPRLNYPDHPRITTYVVDADYVQAGNAAVAFAHQQGIAYEGGFFNPGRREGLKLAYLEAFDQIGQAPHAIFQAVSSGMGVLGAYKGALEYAVLKQWNMMPRFFSVQQTSCAPMATAFHERSERILPHHILTHPQGIATAILRGNPRRTYPYLHRIALDTGGDILAVDAEAIRHAKQCLWEYEGIDACYASAAAVAGMLQMALAGRLPPHQPVLVNITGADRPPIPTPTVVVPWRSCLDTTDTVRKLA